jgi:hypothetical protein
MNGESESLLACYLYHDSGRIYKHEFPSKGQRICSSGWNWRLSLVILTMTIITLTNAAVVKWVPTNGGDLHTKANWDTQTVPGSNDDVIIDIERNGHGAVLPGMYHYHTSYYSYPL